MPRVLLNPPPFLRSALARAMPLAIVAMRCGFSDRMFLTWGAPQPGADRGRSRGSRGRVCAASGQLPATAATSNRDQPYRASPRGMHARRRKSLEDVRVDVDEDKGQQQRSHTEDQAVFQRMFFRLV